MLTLTEKDTRVGECKKATALGFWDWDLGLGWDWDLGFWDWWELEC
jgi:hypothetical protein